MKKNRHEAILSLIEKENIGTQEELMLKLNELGYKVTQATVSRDIKSMKLVKTPVRSGQYKYSCVQNESEDLSVKYYSIISHSVTSVNFAGNMVVVKCFAGMAQAACAAIDNLESSNVIGTLAGDDTIFVLCKDDESAEKFKNYLESVTIEI